MKKPIILLFLQLFILVSCSDQSDDTSDLKIIDSKVVGSWNTSEDLTGNTYTYNADGTAVYINHYGSITDIYNGYWDIKDNVLVSYFLDPDEVYDENWKDHPTMKHYIKFLNDCTLQLTNYNNESEVRIHYRENALTSDKKATEPFIVEFKTGELAGQWVSVWTNTKIYFNDCTFEKSYTEFDYNDKVLKVEIPKGTSFFELEFYMEVASPVEMKFYSEKDTKV